MPPKAENYVDSWLVANTYPVLFFQFKLIVICRGLQGYLSC